MANDWTLHDSTPPFQGFADPADSWTPVYWGGPATMNFSAAAAVVMTTEHEYLRTARQRYGVYLRVTHQGLFYTPNVEEETEIVPSFSPRVRPTRSLLRVARNYYIGAAGDAVVEEPPAVVPDIAGLRPMLRSGTRRR
jgi:hypothetical protein